MHSPSYQSGFEICILLTSVEYYHSHFVNTSGMNFGSLGIDFP